MDNTITMLKDYFEKEPSGEQVEGITILIDGPINQVLDILRTRYPDYDEYLPLVRDAFIEGINVMIQNK